MYWFTFYCSELKLVLTQLNMVYFCRHIPIVIIPLAYEIRQAICRKCLCVCDFFFLTNLSQKITETRTFVPPLVHSY